MIFFGLAAICFFLHWRKQDAYFKLSIGRFRLQITGLHALVGIILAIIGLIVVL